MQAATTGHDRPALEAMLEARSVAVVGASVREDSLGQQMLIELERGGYTGAVYPVNPRYDEIGGLRCYPSVGEIPSPVDLAILGVADARQEEALRSAAEAGVRSAVIFASLYEEPRPGVPGLKERMAAIGREAGMAICGGNGMGFLNVEAGLRATGFVTPDSMRPGPITFISHSGSAFAAFSFNDRGLGFNLVVSSGQELTTTAAEYLEYALGRSSTRVVAMLLETVRGPERFRAALQTAAEREMPIVALKIGRTAESKAMVTAHSGALAGEDGAYEALFDAYGVLRVANLEEMADTLELFVSPRRAGPGGLATVHDSGGERVMFVDLAADLGVPFAQISEATRKRLAETLDPGLEPVNPLDAWGTGIDAPEIFIGCHEALHDDPDTAVVGFAIDLTTEEYEEGGWPNVAKQVFTRTEKPFAVISNLASAIDRSEAAALRELGVPVLEGTVSGLEAIRHLLEYRDIRVRPPLDPPALPAKEVRDRWRARMQSAEPFDEIEGLSLLADYGVPVVGSARAASASEALEAAGSLGFPVAVKTAVAGIQHKSDVGGVTLGISSPQELEAAYGDLAGRLGPEVTVARMASAGVEMALGIVRDPSFGPLVLVAAGGALVELLHDRRFAVPPLDAHRARALVDRLAMRPLLDGVRGSPPADVDSLVGAVVGLSALAYDLGEQIDALDANPVIAGREACVAVDALVIPRGGN